jgi:glycosyltransferase involved in cell wall biosynthesis
VHLHSIYLFHDLVGGHYARRHGVPYIVRPHGMLDPYIWKRSRGRKRVMEVLFQDRVLKAAAAIHYTSEIERDISAPYAHNDRARVVPLGVRLDGFDALPDPARFHERFPETRGKTNVLFLSRLHEKKGLDLLVPAFANAASTRPDLHLVLAGPDDGMVAPCKALAAQHGVSDRVSFTGMLRGEDKLASFAAAAMFALPSYSENFGIAAVEAMAARLPSILSDQVNIWADVQKGGGVEIVTCDVASVTRSIEKLADDADLRRAMGEKARATAHDLYAWPSVAAKLEAMYAEAAARRVGPQ